MLAIFAIGVAGPHATAQDRVAETPHNLSVSGPGPVRAAGEGQVCIFCHAPHNTGGMRPLWNRDVPATSYQIYQSSTLDAKIDQPSGSSKLCLSCHDGTIALGSVLSRADKIRMSGGDFLPAGLTNLGTDLSDDHPISFLYTSGLAASDRQLADPKALGRDVKLDATGRLQCTSCHDAHSNRYGNFLVRDNAYGALCITCHRMTDWQASSHRNSAMSLSGAVNGDWPYATVAENACRSCHRSHTAGGRERLLIHEREEDNCLSCHDGQVGATNILAEIDKLSVHDPRRYTGLHDPTEDSAGADPHVECADCHNAHAVSPQSPRSGYVPIGATLARMPGVDAAGTRVLEARHEYEVCFRCHGDAYVPISRSTSRQVQTGNLRLKFSSLSPSYHPIVVAAKSADTVSLVPGWTRGSLIRCTDCHNNDAGPRAGGSGPDGPHGSTYDWLLERNYTTLDDTVEAESEYAMCYKCHQRSSILSDQSFAFHSEHIVEQRAPCSACHDPHGVTSTLGSGSSHTHLINFDTVIVRPLSPTRPIRFTDTGRQEGNCTLTCHGETHDNRTYNVMDR
jgi:predicted CXXCH cytochrome family protein